ncbi:type III chaperone ShcO1 [Pseudomonas syringae pv. tomato]|uniref:CesT family type III secretion system chaperone n=19 Tax=Pseudomonas syringae group TaxID=136849 RepID=A0AAW4DYU3_PSESX|nr:MULTISPECIES: CesT family type III secretion system chaperone [Pseudomonas]EPN34442.1 type III chaperone ShcS1 [Pseudomonas syringae pv. actinidiae ICMP 19096]KPC06114.1 Type III chaperone ShcS1 [Pseudomonas amygdali pv. lachrymans]AAO58045.1 type III chaperone ShcS1 [Pseudomonas syringae pv. tomato str. DC3000]AVI86607.1 type III chaperone ShcO1 [Pseudomonas syringae pv. tomato]EEB62147.1 type III chaperone ShcS1 [Pseudomonas syringae pv. tomato T1]
MNAFATGQLEYSLKKLGYDAAALQALREEGYLLWKGKNDQTSLLVPSADLDALFVINTLSYIDPEHDGRLLALALHLNLSPVHTMSACIALDVEQNTLCLRYTHDLGGSGADTLLLALENAQALAEQVRQVIETFRRDQGRPSGQTSLSRQSSALMR